MASARDDDASSIAHQDPPGPFDVLVRHVIRTLLDGGKPGIPADECGPWAEVASALYEAHAEGGTGAVRAVWAVLTRRDPGLIPLASAGDDGPLAGAGKAIATILVEGTGADHPPLPPIDHARQLSDLAGFVNRVLGLPRPFKARNRNRAVSYAVRQLLLAQGRLLHDVGEGEPGGTPYVVGDDGAVWPLSGDLLPVRSMLSKAGLNSSEPAFKWLIGDLEAKAFNDAPRVSLAHFWTRRDGALYISSGPTGMVRARLNDGAPTLETLSNGEGGVYFASDAVLPRWQPAAAPVPPHEVAAFRPAIVPPPDVPDYTPEVQRLLLTAWLVALVAGVRPLPALVAVGDKGGGKTHLIRAVTLLITCDEPTTVSHDDRDLWTSAVRRPVLALDNVDSAPPEWLPDLLAAAVTGVAYARRKLYTNTTEYRRVARAALALSTRTAAFVRPDVAERTVPIVTGVFEDAGRKSDSALIAEVRDKRDAVLTWLAHQAVRLLPELPHAPALPGRFVDFGRVVWAHDHDNAADALRALRKAQAMIVRDADPLISAILVHADALLDQHGRWKGSASALVSALQRLGAGLPCFRSGKAIARTLREGKDTLALSDLSLSDRRSGGATLFVLQRQDNGKHGN
jgi:hypothetical protein